jgi:hypothetical protein
VRLGLNPWVLVGSPAHLQAHGTLQSLPKRGVETRRLSDPDADPPAIASIRGDRLFRVKAEKLRMVIAAQTTREEEQPRPIADASFSVST